MTELAQTTCICCGKAIFGRDARLLGRQVHERCNQSYQERERGRVAAVPADRGASTDAPGFAHLNLS